MDLRRQLLEVARRSAARFWVSQVRQGSFASTPAEVLGELERRAEGAGEAAAQLVAMWTPDPATPSGRVAALAGGDPHQLVILALAAAPAISPGVARTYRTLQPLGLTLGLLLELAGTSDVEREQLGGLFAADTFLIGRRLIELDPQRGPSCDARVHAAPSVLAAIRGVEAEIPDLVVDALLPADNPASALMVPEAVLGALAMPNRSILFVGEGDPIGVAAAIADALGQRLWFCAPPSPADPAPRSTWIGLRRDAALTGALVACDLGDVTGGAVGRRIWSAVIAGARRFDQPLVLFARDLAALPDWGTGEVQTLPFPSG